MKSSSCGGERRKKLPLLTTEWHRRTREGTKWLNKQNIFSSTLIFPTAEPRQLEKQSEGKVIRQHFHLVLIDLKHDGLQDEGGGGDHVQRLLGLGQPVDEILQRVVEIRGLRQRLLQLDLRDGHRGEAPSAGTFENERKKNEKKTKRSVATTLDKDGR